MLFSGGELKDLHLDLGFTHPESHLLFGALSPGSRMCSEVLLHPLVGRFCYSDYSRCGFTDVL